MTLTGSRALIAAFICLSSGCAERTSSTQDELLIRRGSAALTVNTAVLPRPGTVVNDVYQFAADHGPLLAHIPCYCGCDQANHVSSQDCFVKARSLDGAVAVWEPHGATCAMCIAIVEHTMKATARHVAPQSIREDVDRRFGHLTSHHTETPPPVP
jgi:uncharacterized protein with PCYCGC motif